MSELDLCTYGPRSAHYTREVAEGLSECVRVLNHHTADLEALPDPAVIHDVIGSVETAIVGLGQLLQQLHTRLAAQAASGRLAANRGDVQNRALRAAHGTKAARRAAAQLADHLNYLFHATDGLHLRQGDGK